MEESWKEGKRAAELCFGSSHSNSHFRWNCYSLQRIPWYDWI